MILNGLAGGARWLLGSSWLVGIAVAAWLTAFLELGMLLLAILGLFMPRRCSAAAERAAIWVSTFARRSARKIGRRN